MMNNEITVYVASTCRSSRCVIIKWLDQIRNYRIEMGRKSSGIFVSTCFQYSLRSPILDKVDTVIGSRLINSY